VAAPGSQTQASRPSEPFQRKGEHSGPFKQESTKHAKASSSKQAVGSPRSATAIFSVGSGMTVHIQGGGGADDSRSGSNCTNAETNDTFTTKGDNESHSFGFDSKGSGSCSVEPSWSYFTVSVKDSGGKEVGHGEALWLGQPSALYPYYAACDQTRKGETPKPWVGISCVESHPSWPKGLEVKISRK
jgi:hypothetical protein